MEKDALTSAPQKDDASTQEAAAQPKSDAEETLAQAEAVAEREAPRGTALTWSAVLVAVATLGLLGLHWFDTRERFAGLQAEVAQRLASSDAAGGEARMLAKQGQEATATLQARLIDLEAKLAESQSQQAAIDALLQDMTRNSDARLLSEIEQALGAAVQQLQLAGNVEAALIALQGADARLASAGRPQFLPLRKVIARDMERLKALPLADVHGIGLRIESVAAAVDSLPLAFEAKPVATPEQAAAAPTAPDSTWTGFARQLAGELWREVKSLIRIERLDRPDPALLAPSHAFFLRENLRLRLLSARLALLQRDGAAFRREVQQSQAWIERYFDLRAAPVQTAVATLKQMGTAQVDLQLPTLSDSLTVLRNLRVAKETVAPAARNKGDN
ncbi:MAG: uroporphyrinogen-III C-methyltransferase [Rhodocyclaceae bacterium]|nr:uroporphyrinogen-III C-methyltransferase [Rhodocyclaceae bacterium]